MISFTEGQKQVDVFPAAGPDRPVLYLHTFGQEGREVWNQLKASGCPDFTLAAVSGLDWNHDMVPWDAPALSDTDAPFTGGADAWLRLLTDRILPQAEAAVPGTPAWRGIAGYSLAGLFALYAAWNTDAFSRAASISGSLWFPGFREYLLSRPPAPALSCLFLSLGDRECRTRNPYLKHVQQHTEDIAAFCRQQGIDTVFRLNPGGHFKNSTARTAAGIRYLLEPSPAADAYP